MSDIVERLQAGHPSIDLRGEAANEIKRLRATLDGCHIAYDKQYLETKQLRKAYASRGAEMDTMREVLATTQGWNEKAMTEIEQLKERNSVLEIAHRQTHKTLDNAYAEIEQLRAQNEQLDVALKKAHDEIDRLTGYRKP